MHITCRFADLVPDQRLEMQAIPRGSAKTAAIEQAYRDGFRGCFTVRDDDQLGGAARWYRDEFRAESTGNPLFTDIFNSLPDRLPNADGTDTSEGHIASKCAFEAWQRDKAPNHAEWLFGIYQNWGNCVGTSLTELLQGVTGIRAMDASLNEIMLWLPANWTYMFRGYCSHGWYGGACANMARKYGYAFSTKYDLPSLGPGFDYDGEQRSEELTSVKWCRNQPDDFVAYVRDKGWFWEQDAITEFSGGADAIKRVVQNKGQIHHGSNNTSGSSTPDKVTRIGGHMQTMQGADWSARTIDFFHQQGITSFNATDNFPCVNHQTWGKSWSGEVADKYWPSWWGPKPEGAWVMGARNQLRYFSDGYVYLPKIKGIPNPSPTPPGPGPVPTPPAHPKIEGEIYAEQLASGVIAIRGVPVLTIDGTAAVGQYRYLVEPVGGGRYRLTPKIL